ncbi:MAG: twin-arginine translocase TatA/TatE family subunit [Myxococcaceae bacterium]
MLNIGTGEIIFIAIAALLILGPQKLPEFARTIGKLVRDFRRQTDDVRSTVEREFYKMDQELTKEVPAPVPQPAQDAIAHGHHAGELPDALPTPEADLSQVMKGAAAAEPVALAQPTQPVPPPEAPAPAPTEPSPEKP